MRHTHLTAHAMMGKHKIAHHPMAFHGLNLKDLVEREKTNLESFSSRVVAIDAYNAIYQFLASIRGPDGQQLSDSEGRVTSHLSGLLYRNVNFLSLGIRPVYVFDGKPPSLKSAEIERRRQIKKDATVKYERAIMAGNMEDARKYAQQTTAMKDGMVWIQSTYWVCLEFHASRRHPRERRLPRT